MASYPFNLSVKSAGRSRPGSLHREQGSPLRQFRFLEAARQSRSEAPLAQ
jgi:hypothetical protein